MGADVFAGLLEGPLADGEQQHGVGAVALGGGGFDIGDDVLAGREVDVLGGTELLAHLALLGTAVDGDGVETHGARVLDGHAAEAAAGTDDGDELAGAGTRLLQALVDG